MKYSSLLIEFYDNILSINKNPIIVLFGEDNTIWFSYNDILTLLGYSNLKLQKNRLSLDKKYFDKYENIYKIAKVKQGIEIQNGIQPHLKMINESGLYVLLSRSNKQIAKNISEQLFSDVLPELRKNGKFVLTNPDKVKMNKLTKKLKLYQSEINRTKKQSFKPNTTGKGYIYIIKVKTPHDGKDSLCYKVGYTSNMKSRMTIYKTGNPDIKSIYHENIDCDRKQLEKCILNLNHLKRLKDKSEIICNTTLEELKNEIKDCKKLLSKYSSR